MFMSEHAFRLEANSEIKRGASIEISINGEKIKAHEGESVAAVMMVEGYGAMRTTLVGDKRGIFCGMGVCFDCLVVIDGAPNQRACITEAKANMAVKTQVGGA
jgi:predicted molibdopterin-dependent oxidoreductase YjgC